MTELLDAQEVGAAPPEWVRDELGGATGSGIRVAVLDSGWDRSIGDDRVLAGVGFVDPDDDFAVARNDDDQDVLGHGTACAGVILEVAPDARIIPVKVFGNTLETSPGTLEAALQWAIEAGVQVINVSLGTRLEGTLQRLYLMCERARQAGIIVVAAAHNGNEESYPAIFEPVIGVAAAKFDSPYHFRYRPDHAHECEGWGVERPVLWIGGERVVRHGTSFAAPGITGIVSLILERNPGARLEDVREMLSRFALPGGETVAVPQTKPAAKRRSRKKAAEPAPPEAGAGTKARGRTAPKAVATPSAEAAKRKPAPAKKAEKPAPAKAATTRAPAKAAASPKRSPSIAAAPPSTADAKPRKRTPSAAKAADTTSAKPVTRSRKSAAAPARPSPASVDTKARKRAPSAAKAADTQAPKSRKTPAAAAKAVDQTPASPRKGATSAAKAADAAAPRSPKRAARPAKAADTAAPKPAERPAGPAKTASKTVDAQPGKRAASKARPRRTPE